MYKAGQNIAGIPAAQVWAAMLLFALAVAPYIGSVRNGYAFDDKPLFHQNRYVMQGAAGIPELLRTDAFASQYLEHGSENHLGGGRYRPLSLVSFALEVELFEGKAVPWFSHLVNVLLYGTIGVVMLCFLARNLFPESYGLCLLVTCIFILHPIHSEVILNVKSRDELLCMLFMLLALLTRKQCWPLPTGCFLLAIFAKEYAVILLVIFPVLFYLRREGGKKLAFLMVGVVAAFACYAAARIHFVGIKPANSDFTILNYPYLYATGVEKAATMIKVLGIYVLKLFWPYPLAYDYSYSQIPYTTFTNPWVWLTVFVYVGLLMWTLNLLKARSPLAFALLFFFGSLALISNVLVNTGQMLGERFLFHPSFGFAIVAGWGIVQVYDKYPGKRIWMHAGLALLAVISLLGIINRVPDWQNEARLYKHDVHHLENNTLAHCNAAAKYLDSFYAENDPALKKQWYNKAMYHSNRALTIYPEDEITQLNLGLLHFNMADYEMAELRWDIARNYSPGHPSLLKYDQMLAEKLYPLAMEDGRAKRYLAAAKKFRTVIKHQPERWDAYYFLGGALAEMNDYRRADIAWAGIKPVTWLGFEHSPEYRKPGQGIPGGAEKVTP